MKTSIGPKKRKKNNDKKNIKNEKKISFNFTFHNYADSKFTLADH